ncbi:N-acetyltransferase [Candidatus Woesearchaeota archaeon]|nr:N-acetyltransferase [Candidatus Woesearchaeota archaeon]
MIHPTADVSPQAKIGSGVRIWHQSQIREEAEIGDNCIISKNVYVDKGVKIGQNSKVQNNCSLYHGSVLENGVFIGPHCVLTNDKNPRAINADGSLKNDSDWEEGKILIKEGASLGARVVILPGITVGQFAMIGAGAVVTKDVPDFGLVYGNPARLMGFVCRCGRKLSKQSEEKRSGEWCEKCVEKGK